MAAGAAAATLSPATPARFATALAAGLRAPSTNPHLSWPGRGLPPSALVLAGLLARRGLERSALRSAICSSETSASRPRPRPGLRAVAPALRTESARAQGPGFQLEGSSPSPAAPARRPQPPEPATSPCARSAGVQSEALRPKPSATAPETSKAKLSRTARRFGPRVTSRRPDAGAPGPPALWPKHGGRPPGSPAAPPPHQLRGRQPQPSAWRSKAERSPRDCRCPPLSPDSRPLLRPRPH